MTATAIATVEWPVGPVLEQVLARAADQVECWLAHGLQKAMSQFNGVVEDSNNEGKKQ